MCFVSKSRILKQIRAQLLQVEVLWQHVLVVLHLDKKGCVLGLPSELFPVRFATASAALLAAEESVRILFAQVLPENLLHGTIAARRSVARIAWGDRVVVFHGVLAEKGVSRSSSGRSGLAA